MRRKRITRYFAIALVSIVIVVGIRAWIEFDKAVKDIFRCPAWFYPNLISAAVVPDTSSQAVRVTLSISMHDHMVRSVPVRYVPVVDAYASMGAFSTYESYKGRFVPVTVEDALIHVVTFDLPHRGNWNLNVTYAFASQDSDKLDCKYKDTYEVNTES